MNLRELTEAEYKATWHGQTMVNKTSMATEVVDIWPYAEAALKANYPNECNCKLDVNHVYESHDGEFQHILIGANTANLYLVIVVNVLERKVEGHYHLNLGKLYGLLDA